MIGTRSGVSTSNGGNIAGAYEMHDYLQPHVGGASGTMNIGGNSSNKYFSFQHTANSLLDTMRFHNPVGNTNEGGDGLDFSLTKMMMAYDAAN
jgi:hypothetical protein